MPEFLHTLEVDTVKFGLKKEKEEVSEFVRKRLGKSFVDEKLLKEAETELKQLGYIQRQNIVAMLPLLRLQSMILFNREFAKVIQTKLSRAALLKRILS